MLLPFFVNALDNLPPRHPTVAGLQLSVGDVLGVPLLSGASSASPPSSPTSSVRPLWDIVALSNYMIDVDWLMSAREGGPALRKGTGTRRLIVLSGERDEGAGAIADGLRRNGWRDVGFGSVALPPKEGQAVLITPHLPVPFGTHHTKAAVCVRDAVEGGAADDAFIRVAVFTANFVYADWRTKNQGIYVQDFPLKGGGGINNGSTPSTAVNSFEHDLARYFTAAGWRGCASIFAKFDFSSAAGHLVASVPGYHSAALGPSAKGPLCSSYWGMWHLKHQLKCHAPSTSSGDALTWQYSSQGSLTPDFLSTLALTMLARRPQSSSLGAVVATPTPSAPSATATQQMAMVRNVSAMCADEALASTTISVVMPTVTEVRRSAEGWRGGLSIPVPAKNLHEFINARLHRWSPRLGHSGGWQAPSPSSSSPTPPLAMTTFGRHRYMPHIKTYLRYSSCPAEEQKDSGCPSADWLLVTSANLSRAAWGDAQKKGTQLMVRSYELGVLFVGSEEGAVRPWEVRGIARASDDRAAALAEGLHRVAIRSGSGGGLGGGALVAYLPYDATAPIPYDSTAALREGRPIDASPRDAPWVVDLPHGGADLFGLGYAEVAGGYSHYGGDATRAPLLRAGMEGAAPMPMAAGAVASASAPTNAGAGRVLGASSAAAVVGEPATKQHRAEGASNTCSNVGAVSALLARVTSSANASANAAACPNPQRSSESLPPSGLSMARAPTEVFIIDDEDD